METPRGLCALTSVWAGHLSEECKRRFYRAWFRSKQKAFTKYQKRWAEAGKSGEAAPMAAEIERAKKYCQVIRAICPTQIGKVKIGWVWGGAAPDRGGHEGGRSSSHSSWPSRADPSLPKHPCMPGPGPRHDADQGGPSCGPSPKFGQPDFRPEAGAPGSAFRRKLPLRGGDSGSAQSSGKSMGIPGGRWGEGLMARHPIERPAVGDGVLCEVLAPGVLDGGLRLRGRAWRKGLHARLFRRERERGRFSRSPAAPPDRLGTSTVGLLAMLRTARSVYHRRAPSRERLVSSSVPLEQTSNKERLDVSRMRGSISVPLSKTQGLKQCEPGQIRVQLRFQ